MPIKEWKIFDIDAERCQVCLIEYDDDEMKTKSKRHNFVCVCVKHTPKNG